MSTPATNLVGQTLGGYELVEAIGVGAMATVFKAFQPNLERWVAVKVLHYKEQSALARFEREAKAIALLRHRNILIVYEYGDEKNWPYIVMEYVQGGTLSGYMASCSMNWVEVVNLIIPVAEALSYAHRQGIVHRDVKPSNILLPQPDWPLLADFGLAKLPSAQKSLTLSGTSMGTPAYVAPEQARGAPIDARSDMYSMGVLLFEMVTGRLPFDYANPNKIMLAHISEPVPHPTHLNSGCPLDFEQIIMTMMQKSPNDRYKDMGEVITALRNVMASSRAKPVYQPPQPAPAVRTGLETMEFSNDQGEDNNEVPQTSPLPPPSPPRPAAEPPATVFPSSIPSPHAQLEARILLTDKNITLRIPEKDNIIVGRTHRNTLADVDLGPYGAAKVGISRRHARLTRQGNRWLIEDLESLNGTFVNEVEVKPGNPVPLKNGDVVRCSHMNFVFLILSQS